MKAVSYLKECVRSTVSYTKSDHTLIKIIPSSKLTNTSYTTIIDALYSTYKTSFKERVTVNPIGKHNQEIHVEDTLPFSYELFLDGDDLKTTPSVNFVVPNIHLNFIKQRIQAAMPGSTVLETSDEFTKVFSKCIVYDFNYVKNSMLSLKISENNFLESLLTLKNDIAKGHKILFQVQMKPAGELWKSFNEDRWNELGKGKDVTNKMNLLTTVGDNFIKGMDEVLGVMDSIVGIENVTKKSPKYYSMIKGHEKSPSGSSDKGSSIENSSKSSSGKSSGESSKSKVSSFSSASRQKRKHNGFYVSVKAYIVADTIAAKCYSNTIAIALKEVEEDNKLKMSKPHMGELKRGDFFFSLNKDLMSSRELAALVNIPNEKIQKRFGLEVIKAKQVNAPKQCLEGIIRLGTLQKAGKPTTIYYPEQSDIACRPELIIAGQGGGKSSALLNKAVDIKNGGKDSIIDINFVDKCQLAYALKEMYGDNHIIINMANENDYPRLGVYEEAAILPEDTPFERKRKANKVGLEIEEFLNSITMGKSEAVTPRMSQYLQSICKIVYSFEGSSLKDIIDCFEDEDIRAEWIQKALESKVFETDSYEIRKALKLDDDALQGTITSILDRISMLQKDTIFQEMIYHGKKNINFLDIIDSNKSLSIVMKEDDFSDKNQKDVIIAYFMSHIRLAMLHRKGRETNKCHIFIDEADHLNNSLNVICKSIAEARKYAIHYIFACHYLNQLKPKLKEAVLSAGSHFVLLKGTAENCFNELKGKIGDDYEYEDLTSMPDFSAFEMLLINGSYNPFVVKMLPVLKDKKGEEYMRRTDY